MRVMGEKEMVSANCRWMVASGATDDNGNTDNGKVEVNFFSFLLFYFLNFVFLLNFRLDTNSST